MYGTIGEACSMYREPSAFVISVCMCVLSVERKVSGVAGGVGLRMLRRRRGVYGTGETGGAHV